MHVSQTRLVLDYDGKQIKVGGTGDNYPDLLEHLTGEFEVQVVSHCD